MIADAQNAPSARGAPAARGRDVTGAVVDIDGSPVAGATVAIAGGGPTTTTGADGSFRLTGVATTSAMVEITADGFTAKQVPVLGAATPLELQVVIVKPAPAAPPRPAWSVAWSATPATRRSPARR